MIHWRLVYTISINNQKVKKKMKLSHKFSIIVLLTILEIFILTFMSLNGSKKMQEMKNLQYVQASTETQLSELINYLNKINKF